MIYSIPESKFNLIIQKAINSELDKYREMSKDWGLGEMDEINEIESIKNINVTKVEKKENHIYAYIDIYTNYERDDFENILLSIEYDVLKWVPNLKLIVDNIY